MRANQSWEPLPLAKLPCHEMPWDDMDMKYAQIYSWHSLANLGYCATAWILTAWCAYSYSFLHISKRRLTKEPRFAVYPYPVSIHSLIHFYSLRSTVISARHWSLGQRKSNSSRHRQGFHIASQVSPFAAKGTCTRSKRQTHRRIDWKELMILTGKSLHGKGRVGRVSVPKLQH